MHCDVISNSKSKKNLLKSCGIFLQADQFVAFQDNQQNLQKKLASTEQVSILECQYLKLKIREKLPAFESHWLSTVEMIFLTKRRKIIFSIETLNVSSNTHRNKL